MSKFFSLSLSYQDRVLNDIPIDKSGFSLSLLVGAKGKHATQTCKLKVQSRDAMKFIIEAEDYIFAKVYQSEVVVFEGVIKPYVAVSASQTTIDSMNIDILDYTELLDKYVFMDLSKFGGTNPSNAVIAQKWKSETVEHILRALFALAGVTSLCTIEFESATGLSKRFDDFRIVDGDVLSDVISNLCYECCLDFRFGVGKVTVYPTDVFDPVATITDYRLKARANRARVKDDGFKLSYQTFTTKRIKIYHEDNRFDEKAWGTIATWEPKKGYYYNKEMHSEDGAQPPTKYTAMWSFKEIEKAEGEDAKITVVDVLDAEVVPSLHDEKGVDITAHLDSYDETGGCAYIAYDGEFNWQFGKGWGFEYTVYANVSYKKEHENPYAVGLKPKRIALKYLDDFGSANHFGETYQTREKQSALTYDFTSSNVLIPGKCYTFKEDTVMGLSSVVRILSSSYDYETKLYHYTAEGANKMAVIPLQPMPTESDDLYPSIPPEQAQFFFLSTNRALFLKEESNDTLQVTAHGFALEQASSLNWIINGHYKEEHARTIEFPVSELQMGQNLVTCRIVLDTVPYERTARVIKTASTEGAIIQYRWGKNPLSPPIADGGLWFWNGKVIFHGGRVVGNTDSESWKSVVPVGTADSPYLWMRVSMDSGKSWAYTRLPGKDDVFFRIESNRSTYPYNVRGAVTVATTVKMKVIKTNTVNPCTWQSVPSIFEPVTADQIEFTIPVGLIDSSILIKANIEGLPEQYYTLTAQETGTAEPLYVGATFTLQELQGMTMNPRGVPWVEGDHAVVVTQRIEDEKTVNVPLPYVYHAAEPHWRLLSGDDEAYSSIWNNTIVDSLKQGNVKLECAAQYGIFSQLAALDAFIRFLRVYHILMDPGDFHFEIKGVDENGNILQTPVFEIAWKGKNLFKINFSANAPEVIIGDYDNPDAGGIKWDAGNNKLDIRGIGKWGGLLNTPTIRTEQGGDFWVTEPDVSSLDAIKRYIKNCGGTSGQWVPLGGTFHGVKLAEGMYEDTKIWHHQWYRTSPAPFGQTWYWGDSATVWTRTTSLRDVNGTVTRFVERASWWTNNMNRGSGSLDYPPYREGPFPTAHKYTETDIDNYGTKTDTYPDTETSKLAGIGPSERPWTSADIITGFGHWNHTQERLFIDNLPNECPPEPNAVYRSGNHLMISPAN